MRKCQTTRDVLNDWLVQKSRIDGKSILQCDYEEFSLQLGLEMANERAEGKMKFLENRRLSTSILDFSRIIPGIDKQMGVIEAPIGS